MDGFAEELEKLREAGIGLGLDDRQIDQCMVDALKAAKKSLAPPSNDANVNKPTSPMRAKTAGVKETTSAPRVAKGTGARPGMCRLCCRYAVRVMIALVLLFVCLSVLVEYYPQAAQVMMFMDTWIYTIVRWWRILTLPLARRMDLTAMYDGPCAVYNPFMSIPRMTCERSMKTMKGIETLETITSKEFEEKYQNSAKLLVLKGHAERLIPYTSLRTWYNQNEFSLRISRNVIRVNSDLTMDELLSNYTGKDIRARPDFHFDMFSAAVNPSRLLRRLFPRPDFLPSNSEVAMDKTLTVDSPTSHLYPLPLPMYSAPNHWYVQGGGSRRLYFHPLFECFPEGKLFTTIVNAGDIVYFHGPFWRIESAPARNDISDDVIGDDVSVAFVGSFV